jgi:hypothetical protein
MRRLKPEQKPLEAKIAGGVLYITIGIGTLTWAANEKFENDAFIENEGRDEIHKETKPIKVLTKNRKGFALNVVREMENSSESGETPLIHFFDDIIDEVVSNGSEFVEYPKEN